MILCLLCVDPVVRHSAGHRAVDKYMLPSASPRVIKEWAVPYRLPKHNPIGWRPAAAKRDISKHDSYYSSPEWKRLRLAVLERDMYMCRLKLPGCTGRANTADHRKPRAEGGPDEMWNLRSSCPQCHNRRHPEKAKW